VDLDSGAVIAAEVHPADQGDTTTLPGTLASSVSMERSAQVQLTAKAAGRPLLIDHRAAVATREQLGGDLVAWINYQPLWQDISRSEPDLLS